MIVIFFVICVPISYFMLWLTRRVGQLEEGNKNVFTLAVMATLLFGVLSVSMFLSMFAAVLALQSLIIAICAFACVVMKTKPVTLFKASVGATVISYVCVILMGVQAGRSALRGFDKLRADYPLVSITHRLQYERTDPEADSINDAHLANEPLSPLVEQQLSSFEKRRNRMTRQRMLFQLHNTTSGQFMMASGFGMARMFYVSRRYLDLPEVEPIPLPTPPATDEYEPQSESEPAVAAIEPTTPTFPVKATLESMHVAGSTDFLDRERMGYIVDIDHVAGFESHAFQEVPKIVDHDDASPVRWLVTHLDLVSLLKHPQPVAYISETLPRMDELKDAPTRPLDAFEEQALTRLHREENLVVQEGTRRVRMLGALRAGKDCLQCHAVERGTLLGAFSYELVRHLAPTTE